MLEVDCRERVFRASSAGESLADATAQVFWSASSCPRRASASRSRRRLLSSEEADPGIRSRNQRDAASDPAAAPISLTAIYDGPDGFRAPDRGFRIGRARVLAGGLPRQLQPRAVERIAPAPAEAGPRRTRPPTVQLSDQMRQFLGASTARAEVPNVILGDRPRSLAMAIDVNELRPPSRVAIRPAAMPASPTSSIASAKRGVRTTQPARRLANRTEGGRLARAQSLPRTCWCAPARTCRRRSGWARRRSSGMA